jgi:hypothetical protein
MGLGGDWADGVEEDVLFLTGGLFGGFWVAGLL